VGISVGCLVSPRPQLGERRRDFVGYRVVDYVFNPLALTISGSAFCRSQNASTSATTIGDGSVIR
jgi:hypothetical protein